MPEPGGGPLRVVVDVSDTLASPWRAGIQRVVVQLVAHLRRADPRIELELVAWSVPLDGFRRLTPAERDDLLDRPVHDPGPSRTPAGDEPGMIRATRTARRVVGRVVRSARLAVGAVLRATGLREPLRRAVRGVSLRTVHRDHIPLAVGDLAPGSVLLELDTVWNQTAVDREELYRTLRARGVHIATVLYDLLPLEHPEWFEASLVEVFDTTMRAQARHTELILAISRSSVSSWETWTSTQRVAVVAPSEVLRLGADAVDTAREAPLPAEVPPGRYVLVVGTVEPRKNHAVLLDAFERLAPAVDDLHLVIVGRPGWENDDVVRRLESQPMRGTRLHWFRAAGDDVLATLYRHALVVAVPSATEGFGLPVIEAFRHGVPVVASTGGALREAGGDLAEYEAPGDVEGWAAAVARHAQHGAHNAARREALVGYEAPTWSDTADQVAASLVGHFGDGRRVGSAEALP